MGLIDFLEGAYRGGRLLFLLYDHDKQVKLRYKAMKGRGIKILSSTTDNITRLREITSENIPLGYADFGEIGHIVGKASESLLRAAKLRKQQLEINEYHFLNNRYEKK